MERDIKPTYDELESYIERLDRQRTDAQATITALQAQLATCFKLSGADPDGNEDWRLAPHAVEEVTRLRKDYDELGDETEALRDQLTQRTAELEAAVEMRDGCKEPNCPQCTRIAERIDRLAQEG